VDRVTKLTECTDTTDGVSVTLFPLSLSRLINNLQTRTSKNILKSLYQLSCVSKVEFCRSQHLLYNAVKVKVKVKIKIKVKVMFTVGHTMKAQKESKGIVVLFL
jgi:hypothetical protein